MSDLKLSAEELTHLWQAAQDQAVTGAPAPFHFAKAVVELQARRTQPEATAPAQDLSAAILEMEVIGVLIEKVRGQFGAAMDSAYCPSSDAFKASRREFFSAVDSLEKVLSLASSANALSAGDRVDAGPTDAELLDFVAAHPEMTLRHHKRRWSFVGFTNYEYDAFKTPREAIAAAILQSQKGDHAE